MIHNDVTYTLEIVLYIPRLKLEVVYTKKHCDAWALAGWWCDPRHFSLRVTLA